MRRSMMTLASVAITSLLIEACTSSAGQNRHRGPGDFTLEELVGVTSMVDGGVPDWAPDGSRIVFVGRDTLWSIAPSGGRPEAIPVQAPGSAAYSPDGKYIGYVSSNELWLWSVSDRRATRLTDMGARMNSWQWSPDGTRIAFANSQRGNLDIYVVQVPGGGVQRISSDTRYEMQPSWTPDGKTVLYVRMDERWLDHDVMAVGPTGGDAQVVIQDRDFFDYRVGAEFGPAQVSPDGSQVLFRSHRSNWLNWWIVPLAGGRPRPLAEEAADQSSQKPFRGYARWSPDGRHVAYTSNLNGTMVLRVAAVDGSGVRTVVAPTTGVIANPAWSPDGKRIAYTFDTPTQPMDLHVVDVATGTVSRLTRSLSDSTLLAALVAPEKVEYRIPSGHTIHAYLFKPATTPPPGGFPGLVWVHGGPTAQFDDSWDRHWEAHYFIKHGYAVLSPNIRGSSGYSLGFEHANNGCWARCDLDDVVAGARFLASLPGINPDRIGVTGTSYGGYLSIAASTFAPGVFRAAVATGSGYSDRIRAVAEWSALAEINMYQFEMGPLASNREKFRLASPIYFAQDLDTPLMMVGSEGEKQMSAFATEAARYYKPVRYLPYASVDGSKARLDWMPQMLTFLDRYVKGPVNLKPAAAVASVPLRPLRIGAKRAPPSAARRGGGG